MPTQAELDAKIKSAGFEPSGLSQEESRATRPPSNSIYTVHKPPAPGEAPPPPAASGIQALLTTPGPAGLPVWVWLGGALVAYFKLRD